MLVTPSAHSRLKLVEKARLAAEIMRLYATARWRLRRADLPTVLTDLRRGSRDADSHADEEEELWAGRVLGKITTQMLSALPTDGRCLIRSLVLTGLLSRRGIESRLVLAVHPGERLAAHAWVEYESLPLLEPGAPPLERLTEL
jgi:hypothetical protein